MMKIRYGVLLLSLFFIQPSYAGFLDDWIKERQKGMDTDSDGLSDYDEIYVHYTNHNKQDTDEDGLIDGDEVNNHLTNPKHEDTDLDTLSDYDEVSVHLTNPLLKDTDGDTLEDQVELAMGAVVMDFNPTQDSTYFLSQAKEIAELMPPQESSDEEYFVKPTSGDQVTLSISVRDTDGLEKGWQSTNTVNKAMKIRESAQGVIKLKR